MPFPPRRFFAHGMLFSLVSPSLFFFWYARSRGFLGVPFSAGDIYLVTPLALDFCGLLVFKLRASFPPIFRQSLSHKRPPPPQIPSPQPPTHVDPVVPCELLTLVFSDFFPPFPLFSFSQVPVEKSQDFFPASPLRYEAFLFFSFNTIPSRDAWVASKDSSPQSRYEDPPPSSPPNFLSLLFHCFLFRRFPLLPLPLTKVLESYVFTPCFLVESFA